MIRSRAYRKFCIIVVLVVAGVLAYNLVVWNLFTKQLLTRTEGIYGGDLARMGYLHEHTALRRNTNDLPRKHLELTDYRGQHIDVVTVGDSFSGGGGAGPNRFYQDYIASIQGLNVLNFSKIPDCDNLIECVAILANSGILERINPRFVLVERVERNLYEFGGSVDLGKRLPAEQLEHLLFDPAPSPEHEPDADDLKLPDVGFMNTGNAKWLWYKLCYFISPNAFTAKVYKEQLNRPLFSGKHGDSLLFLDKDLNKYRVKRKALDERAVRRINDNMNRLASLLAELNIQLVFMPAPDKYSLYRPYLLEKRYSRSALFEHLRWQPKTYRLIDTDAILAQELKNGVKDLYWIDDTHWSWKASKAIFEQFRF